MALAYWKLPTRRWLLATRARTAPGSRVSRRTWRSGRHHGERAGGRDAEGVHRLADDVLAQHRADRGQTVTAAGERGAPGALEVQVARLTVGVDEFAEQQRPPVAETRGIGAELMPGVGLGDRGGAAGNEVADQQIAGRRGSAARRGRGRVRWPAAR